MLSEEALIVLAAFGACGLLMLGVLELVWPTQPRHPVRRPPARRPVARVTPLPRAAALERPAPSRRPAPARRAPIAPPVETPAPVAVLRETAPPMSEPLVAAPPVVEPVVVEPIAARAASVVDECFALQQSGRHTEVLELAIAALRGDGAVPRLEGAQETAALWSIVALAQQGLGEPIEARTALEAAVAAAPAPDRPTYQRQLATLAEGVARRLLAEAEQHPRGDTPECLDAVRSAVDWLAHGVVAAPADAGLAELNREAQARLWRVHERSVMALLQRQEFRAARRLLREALEDPRFPADQGDAFRDLLTGTFNGEIGQLTAQAIRTVQDGREPEALRALRRAESLLATLSDEALTPKRREEVDRRLWWVYSRLGERRLEAGDHTGALEPLVHALGYDVGEDRHEETRALLERALDAAPDREAAIIHCDRLWAQLRGAQQTLAGDDLPAAPEPAPALLAPQER
jgi:tetratricopeptide (TPR) repeat protein